MRERILCSVFACLYLVPAWSKEYRYVEAGTAHEYAIEGAPHPAQILGTLIVRAVHAVRSPAPGNAGAQSGNAGPLSLGIHSAFRALNWQTPRIFPLILVPAIERVAALHVRASFRVGVELSKLRVLRVRAIYQDGLVVLVNGVEKIRKNVDPDGAWDRFARTSHGPEWESFYIPVEPGLLRPGENTVEIEARPGLSRFVPFLDFEIVAAEEAHIVRGPVLQRVERTRAAVFFETDIPTTASVYFRKAHDTGSERSVPLVEIAQRHEAELIDLPPGAAIEYRVTLPDWAGEWSQFRTAPDANLHFVVYGDVRSGHEVHAKLLDAIRAEDPDFVVATGDMVLRGVDEADWQRFFAVAGSFLPKIPMYPVIGNHDIGDTNGRTFEEIFLLWPGPPERSLRAAWYSFDVAGVHFVMLDSNQYMNLEQLAWLERDLDAAKDARAIFAVTHHGPYSHGPHGGNALAVASYVPLFNRHGVKAVFSGHDHMYERGKVGPLHYFVSGGGGAPLYPAKCRARGSSRCGDGVAAIFGEYHYIDIRVTADRAHVCPKRVDATPLEICTQIPLGSAH